MAAVREFTSSVHFLDVAFECGFFDVAYDAPCKGVNLIMTRRPEPEQYAVFEARVAGELRHAGDNDCIIWSSFPLDLVTHCGKALALGIRTVEETEDTDPFGPFYCYWYRLNG